MPRYLSLINFTDEGIRNVKNSVQRADAFRLNVEKAGGKMHGMYWAVGEFDGALIFEVPDESTATALLLRLGSAGFVRTRTLQVNDAKEFADILKHC